MRTPHVRQVSRRRFLGGLTLAGTAGLLGLSPKPVLAEPPPETRRIRLVQIPGIWMAPQYVAEALLRSEGFTEVSYLQKGGGRRHRDSPRLRRSRPRFALRCAAPPPVGRGRPHRRSRGIHIGCFELFGTHAIRTIRDLRGKTVAVPGLESSRYVFFATMAAYVGLDPRKDFNVVNHPGPEAMRLLAEGKIDAYLGFTPEPQEMREQQIGHVIVNSTLDRPWSQYFCCMLVGNREFVRTHPVATKRALRAILKAADVCAREPEQVARFIVDKGYAKRYDYALQALKEIPYGQWREYSAEDTLRFYALRLHEVGMLKSSPQKLLAQGTDWRFLTELKKELKG